jgi:hypothetical protein
MMVLRITIAIASLFLFVALFKNAPSKLDCKERVGGIISELKGV